MATKTSQLAKRVRQATATMSRAERRIARTLHATNFRAGLGSVANLASQSNVSGPTVIRFTTKLGYRNFRTFQQAAAAQFNERVESPAHQFRRSTTRQPKIDMRSVSGSIVDCLRETFEMTDEREFRKIVRLLANDRRNVCTIGGQSSRALADMLAARLFQIRPAVRSVGGQPLGYSEGNQLPFLGARDIVVVFDFRRYQESTIRFARIAADQGSSIVLFTDTWLSPIVDFAHHVLTIEPGGHLPYDFLTPCLGLIETLMALVLAELDPAEAGARIALCEKYDTGLLGSDEALLPGASEQPADGAGDDE